MGDTKRIFLLNNVDNFPNLEKDADMQLEAGSLSDPPLRHDQKINISLSHWIIIEIQIIQRSRYLKLQSWSSNLGGKILKFITDLSTEMLNLRNPGNHL